MGRILRDVSERNLIVQGKDEVYRIQAITDSRKYIFKFKHLYDDVFSISLISRVGSYYPKVKHNG